MLAALPVLRACVSQYDPPFMHSSPTQRLCAAAAVPTEPPAVPVLVDCAAAGLQGVAAAPPVRQAAVQVARTPPSSTGSWTTTMATR